MVPTLENMYLLRDATGIRNMTVGGLSGTLSAANSYGTKRSQAGAYCIIDPGMGTRRYKMDPNKIHTYKV